MGQQLRIPKATLVDSIAVDSAQSSSFSMYLPSTFTQSEKWPVLLILNMDTDRSLLKGMVPPAEELGYLIAAPNALSDTLSVTANLVHIKKVLESIKQLFPIQNGSVYAVGQKNGGRLANLVPVLLKNVAGALSINASLANFELLNAKNRFHFIGLVDKHNFTYKSLLRDEAVLNASSFPNQLLVTSGAKTLQTPMLTKALRYFKLAAMTNGNTFKDNTVIAKWFQEDMQYIRTLKERGDWLLVDRAMAESMNAFRGLLVTDSLKSVKNDLKRNKVFRQQRREQQAAFFKEGLLKEDFTYYLEEDVLTYNFNNLGWWNYQMGQLEKYTKSTNSAELQMGYRLTDYVNALIEDTIDKVKGTDEVDEEALVFLYMLKTLTAPSDMNHYLKVVALASKNEDFGTALFYLEEAFRKGLKDKTVIYNIPHTALLRITPKFNALVDQYLDGARYEIKD